MNYRFDLILVRELGSPGTAARAAIRLDERTDRRRITLGETLGAWRDQVHGMGRVGASYADAAEREVEQILAERDAG